ncbi:MAG: 50S ribosomal protein L10 [Terriglobia bacterium]
MAKSHKQKQSEVENLHGELLRVSTLVLATFRGFTVQQDTELRRGVENAGGKYRVVKNSLAERAAKQTPAEPLLKGLEGVNSIAYTDGDPVALAKALSKYAKENEAFRFYAGLVEGRVVSMEELQELAALPSREGLLAKLLGLLQAPAQRLASLLSAPARQLALVVKVGTDEKKFAES